MEAIDRIEALIDRLRLPIEEADEAMQNDPIWGDLPPERKGTFLSWATQNVVRAMTEFDPGLKEAVSLLERQPRSNWDASLAELEGQLRGTVILELEILVTLELERLHSHGPH